MLVVTGDIRIKSEKVIALWEFCEENLFIFMKSIYRYGEDVIPNRSCKLMLVKVTHTQKCQ